MAQASTLLAKGLDGANLTHTEGSRWHEGRIWFDDLFAETVYSAKEDGSDLRVEAKVPGVPSGLGWLPDGRLLVVSMLEQQVFRREHDGSLVIHADLRTVLKDPSHHANDMVVSSDGTAYVSSFGFDLRGSAPVAPVPLLRVTPEGEVFEATEPLYFPNGCTISDDGRTLIVAESLANRLSAFEIRRDGTLSDREDWISFGAVPAEVDLDEVFAKLNVAGDGISCPDVEGGIWVADFLRTRAVRVLPGRGIVDEVQMASGLNCYAATLGGSDGRTLFLCATPPELDPDVHLRNPRSELQTHRVSVPAVARCSLAD